MSGKTNDGIVPDRAFCQTACEDAPRARWTSAHCPACGRAGKALDEITLKALLRGDALARRRGDRHRFCATPSCPVVYFDERETFTRDDLTVAVFQKEAGPDRPVCYCFDVGEVDIRRGAVRADGSSAGRRIAALVDAGRCACEIRNPQGTCCLGNVRAVERAAREGAAVPHEGARR